MNTLRRIFPLFATVFRRISNGYRVGSLAQSGQLILLNLVSLSVCEAQVSDPDEQYINQDIQESNQQELIEMEEHLKARRFRINQMTAIEMGEVPYLTQENIMALLRHIQHYGPINSIHELQIIESFDTDLIHKLLPYLDFNLSLRDELIRTFTRPSNTYSITIQNSFRVEKSAVYSLDDQDPRKYQGERNKILLRFTAQSPDKLNYGFHFEKDAGESLSMGHLSGFIHIRMNSLIRELIVGDYICQFGQGILIGSGMSINKSSSIQNSVRVARGYRPFRSGTENGYWRGLGLKLDLGKSTLYLAASISSKDLKPSLDSSSNDNLSESSTTGYYRNQKEIDARNTGFESKSLLRYEFQRQRLKLGLTLSAHHAAIRVKNSMQALFKDGYQELRTSIDYQILGKRSLHYGEFMLMQSKQFGFVHGMLKSLGQYADLSLVFRKYTRQLELNTSSSIAESGAGETGLFAALNSRIGKSIQFNTYLDLYSLNAYTYSRDGPVAGKDAMIEFKIQKRSGLLTYLRTSISDKPSNETGLQTINRLENNRHRNYRLHLEYPLGHIGKLYHRIEQSEHIKQYGSRSKGWLLYHELQIAFRRKLKLHLRYCQFSIDDHITRIYSYEHDISHSFTVRAYQNRGEAFYAVIQISVNKYLRLKLRFASQKYDDLREIGTGLDAVPGNTVRDIRMEMQVRL